jgi:hypothetical protein
MSHKEIPIADADAPFPTYLTPSEIDSIGSIRVSVYRAREKIRETPRKYWGEEDPEPLDEISERALKGKAIKNNIKYCTHEITRTITESAQIYQGQNY